MQKVKKLLLVGPSSRIRELHRDEYERYRTAGYKIFCYTGGISYLSENDIRPEYFSFLDPQTYGVHHKCFVDDYFKDTTLVIARLYDFDLSTFKQLGLTCGTMRRRHPKLLKEFITLDFMNKFKDVISPVPLANVGIGSPNFLDRDWRQEYNLIHNAPTNTDKFACFVLPTILYCFPEVTEIVTVGFGDLDVPRAANGSTGGYPEFSTSFKAMIPSIVSNFNKHNIKLQFIHNNLYSKALRSLG